MPPRFDADSLTLRLSVADLLDPRLGRHLGFTQRGGRERMWLGQAIHCRYQEEAQAADARYQKEVPLRLEMEHRGWRVVLEGRADGLRSAGDGQVVVEEIKSVRRGQQLSPTVLELYRRQAMLYRWMLERLGRGPAAAELVLIEIGSERVERQPVEGEVSVVEAAVRQRLNRLLREFEQRRLERDRRRAAASGLAFPYPAYRPGQEQIVSAVGEALERGEHRLIQATTGIGKTVAALYPALRHALETDRRVFVLTAKTLQQAMATAVLAMLNPRGVFNSVQVRAKAKMCANDEVICHEEYCPYARDYFLKLQRNGLLEALVAEHGTLLPDVVYEQARAAEVCPFEISLELAGRSQAVVCDYNYAFAPYVALSEFGQGADLTDTILVIDEIHNLVDRGRGYYSPELSALAARRAAAMLDRVGAPVCRRIAGTCLDLAATLERWVAETLELEPGDVKAAEAGPPDDAIWALRAEMDEAFVDYLEHQRETKSFRAEDPFVGLYFDFLRFLDGLSVATGERFSHLVERDAGDARLRVLCKDASPFLGEVINRTHATIGLSATLSPPEFYRDLLGFDAARTVAVVVPNPFPAANRRVVIDTTVATTWRKRAENYAPIARGLSAFADSVPGNCLVLFPSYDFLRQVASHLAVSSKRILIQSRSDGDREREEILDALRSALLGDVLLLAVAGGVFAEGVDYPGEVLKGVAVVGPCLPAVSLERDLLRSYYQDRFEKGFEYAFVVPGMTRVVQAAGRLIRSPADTGVIALFGRRFLERPYRGHLPADWLEDGAAESLTGDPARAGIEFFDVAGS